MAKRKLGILGKLAKALLGAAARELLTLGDVLAGEGQFEGKDREERNRLFWYRILGAVAPEVLEHLINLEQRVINENQSAEHYVNQTIVKDKNGLPDLDRELLRVKKLFDL